MEAEFDSLNSLSFGLEYVEGDTPEKLKEVLKSIRLPTKIISLYEYRGKHIAWIMTTAKLKRKNSKPNKENE
jgi:hypothetical protein